MKYKIGDRVIIRTWEDMEKEFGLNENDNINNKNNGFVRSMEIICREIPDRIFRIEGISHIDNVQHYIMEKVETWKWTDEMIEYSLKELEEKTWIPIVDRFEILDL